MLSAGGFLADEVGDAGKGGFLFVEQAVDVAVYAATQGEGCGRGD